MLRDCSNQASWNRFRDEAFAAPWLSPDAELALIASAQAGDRAATNTLYASHRRLVVQIASRYDHRALQPEDLVAEGSIGLLEAIQRFDCSRHTRLSTYAAWWIRARVREYAFEQRSIVHPPTTRGARIVRAHLITAERKLMQELGRMPTRAELASRLGVAEADVNGVTATLPGQTSSLGDDTHGAPLEARDEDAGPEELFAIREASHRLELGVQSAVAALGERDRQIVCAHFLREDASMAELGNTLGITRQRVSQIVRRVRKKLEHELCDLNC